MSDNIQTIKRAALHFLSGTMISRFTGLARDVSMAFAFGTEPVIALFMVSFRFSHLFRRLFGEGSLQNTFIPHFEELRKENNSSAFYFFRDLSSLILIILAVCITATYAAVFGITSLYSFSESTEVLITLTCLMLPSLFFICLYGLNSALLECEKNYFTPSVAPVTFNLVWIAFSLSLMTFPPLTAVKILAIGVIFACMAQWAYTLPALLKIIQKQEIGNFWQKVNPFSKDVKKLIFPLFLANLGIAASQINNAIDPLFALFADAEGPAWLWYALRIQQLPTALFGIALSGALLPPVSRAIKKGDTEAFKNFFHFAEEKLLIVTLLIAAAAIITAPTAVNLLFGRGNFSLESVSGTALCLIGYAAGLPAMSYILIGAPTLYAFNDYKNPTRAAFYAMLLSTGLNGIFIFLCGLSAASVAFSTAIAAGLNALLLRRTLQKKTEIVSHFPNLLPMTMIALGGMGLIILLDYAWLGQVPAWAVLMGSPLKLSQNFVDQVALFSAEASVFLGWVLGASYLSKIHFWK